MVGQASSGTHTQEHLPPDTHRPRPDLCTRGEYIRLTGLILQSDLRQPAAAGYRGQRENRAFWGYYAESSSKVELTATLPLPPATRTNPTGCLQATQNFSLHKPRTTVTLTAILHSLSQLEPVE